MELTKLMPVQISSSTFWVKIVGEAVLPFIAIQNCYRKLGAEKGISDIYRHTPCSNV